MGDREYIKGENEAKRLLRQEVGFGCPICRDPLLIYHHFDPPWREQHHWNPEGVIALCDKHHRLADGGIYTKQQLRDLKAASYSVTDIKERFPSTHNEFIVRVGGLYSCGSRAVIRVGGKPVIQITTSEDELLSVSFILRSKDGTIIAQMTSNVFEVGPTVPFDVKTDATRIRVWHESRNVGIDVSLKRLAPEELDEVLNSDMERMNQKVYSKMPQHLLQLLLHLPPDIADRIREEFVAATTPLSPEEMSRQVAAFRERYSASELPDHFLQAHFSGDPVGHRVKAWAAANCTDSDGRISFLNFDNLSLYDRDRHIHIRNGMGNIDYNAVVNCDTAFSL